MSDRIHTLSGYLYEYQKSVTQPEEFWARIADSFHWRKRWSKVLDWDFKGPDVKWFVDGKLNITENIFERHMYTLADRPAIIWEPNDPSEEGRTLTYRELFTEVCKFSNALKSKGIGKGDKVIIYMPMVPEAAVAMLACARIGAIHSVVFAGFSSTALADRIIDCEAKAVLTSDGNFRGNKKIGVKSVVDEALEKSSVETVIVYQRTHQEVEMKEGRDYWWHDVVANESSENKAEEMDSEDMLFILYTSGSTGKPKGVVHTTGGYMVYTKYSFENVFQYSPGDVYWCTADIGWITGHSYIVYGPLLAGATTLMFEGVPTFPDAGRFWAVCEKHKVNVFYTAPTAIRALQAYGTEPIDGYDLSSLKVLGSVGEPINEEAWHWYHTHIGKSRCPIVDTWWQTETGAIMISPLPGCTPSTPGTATLPFFGVDAAIFDDDGNEVKGTGGGKLVVRKPWPSMLRTIYGDKKRYKDTYWSGYKDTYLAGDGAHRDKQKNFWIVGRLDDVLNVSGHRLGTAEVESALVSHSAVAEAAVVGRPHEIKGQAVVAFVTVKEGYDASDALAKELRNHVAKAIGAIAKPDDIRFAAALPKTRSGKIMRRLLKEICAGGEVKGDTTTLEDLSVVAQLSASGSNEE